MGRQIDNPRLDEFLTLITEQLERKVRYINPYWLSRYVEKLVSLITYALLKTINHVGDVSSVNGFNPADRLSEKNIQFLLHSMSCGYSKAC